jgi:N-acetyl-alpha-D-muramate 1-phosphate uridylyltransferase
MRAMILAAGRGERMGALTATLPKPLLPIDGDSLIVRQLRRLAAAGVDEVVVNVSYRGEQIRAALGDGAAYGLLIHYSQEPTEPLETAGGIVAALPLLGDAPFLLTNADVVSDFDFARLTLGDADGVLALAPNPDHHASGDYGLGADGRLTARAPKFTYTGIALLSPALFAGLAPGRRPLAPLFDRAIAAGRLAGVLHEGLWIDVGTPERLAAARVRLRAPGP